MTDESRVASVFDAWAREGRDEGMERRHALTGGPVLEALSLGEGVSFLDVGCGNGWAARFAARRGACAVGVDVARRMLQKGIQGPRVGLLRARFSDLPFPSSTFQVAFSMEALYYAGSVQAALREVHRVLEPGGGLHALIDYYEENPASLDWPEKTGVRMKRLSEEAWGAQFERAGFVGVETGRVRVEDQEVADWKAEHGSLHVRGFAER